MKNKRKRKQNWVPFITFVAVIIFIIFIVFFLIKGAFFGKKDNNSTSQSTTTTTAQNISTISSESVAVTTATTTAATTTTTNKTQATKSTTGFTSSDIVINGNVTKNKIDMYNGDLILVNAKIKYKFTEQNKMVSVYENKNSSYGISKTNIKINDVCMDPLNNMLKDFKSRYSDSLLIVSGFRTYQSQEELWDNKVKSVGAVEAAKWVAPPSTSEHHTGYAFDFQTNYEGLGNYKWINDNSYKYGFVVRYKPEKMSITGINSEPWHFRYVGIPHAYYMVKNNLCLEEYITKLRDYPANGNHLKFSDHNGKSYEIYYVKATGEKTLVPVSQNNNFKISGNNIDGFIVTIYK